MNASILPHDGGKRMHTRADALRKILFPAVIDTFIRETGLKKSGWNRFANGTGALFERELQSVAEIFGVEVGTFALRDGRAILCKDWESAKREAEDVLKCSEREVKDVQPAPETSIMQISKGDLHIDESYQRTISQGLVKRIAEKWDWLYLGVIHVAEINGSYYVVDGQHRLEAAKKRKDVDNLPCIVHKNVDQETAAEMFLGINGAIDALNSTRKPLTPYQKFKALLIAKDKTAVTIQNNLDLLGYKIPGSPRGKGKSLNAVAAVYNAFVKDEEHARQALITCTDIMNGKPLTQSVFWGVYEFARNADRYDPPVPFDKWRQRLIKIGYQNIDEAITTYTRAMRKTGPGNCGIGVLNAYNHGLKDRVEWVGIRGRTKNDSSSI